MAKGTYLLVCTAILGFVGTSRAAEQPPMAWHEDFQDHSDPLRFFNAVWHNYKRQPAATLMTVYRIAEENGNRYLAATYDHTRNRESLHLGYFFREKKRSLENFPILSWRWRADHLPSTGPGVSPIEDTPVTVYVIFEKTLFSLKGVKFLWTPRSDSKKGLYKKEWSGMSFHILRTGRDPLGTWIDERIDLCALYRAQFDSDRCNSGIEYLGVLTDADQSASKSAGAYDDFRWSQR
ncbi:MAG: hypothetical protein A2284_14400 [Deltaproteobacteria bacterium RIFOXYA12_FULL_61_11]|nr:MAG: hypothetical protein A2284_14400 [Deltaproteobacteria bacterium RIFOXYA12_FULL_61_11]